MSNYKYTLEYCTGTEGTWYAYAKFRKLSDAILRLYIVREVDDTLKIHVLYRITEDGVEIKLPIDMQT